MDKILYWAWLLLTPVVIYQHFRRRWIKRYSIFLGLLFFLSLLPMGIPLLIILAYTIDLSGAEARMAGPYRLQENARSVIAIPKVEVIRPYGLLLEKRTDEMEFYFEVDDQSYSLKDVKTIVVVEAADSVRFDFSFPTGTVSRKIKR